MFRYSKPKKWFWISESNERNLEPRTRTTIRSTKSFRKFFFSHQWWMDLEKLCSLAFLRLLSLSLSLSFFLSFFLSFNWQLNNFYFSPGRKMWGNRTLLYLTGMSSINFQRLFSLISFLQRNFCFNTFHVELNWIEMNGKQSKSLNDFWLWIVRRLVYFFRLRKGPFGFCYYFLMFFKMTRNTYFNVSNNSNHS